MDISAISRSPSSEISAARRLSYADPIAFGKGVFDVLKGDKAEALIAPFEPPAVAHDEAIILVSHDDDKVPALAPVSVGVFAVDVEIAARRAVPGLVDDEAGNARPLEGEPLLP